MSRHCLPLLAITLLAGCTDFDTRWLVEDFRVLAVRAVDSPEEQVAIRWGALEDGDSFAGLPIGFTVIDDAVDFIIEPLIVDPAHPDGPFELRARACLYREDNPTCDALEDDQPVVTAVEGIRGRSGRDLTFRFNAPADFLNAALAADPLRGFGGLFLLLDIEIEGPSGRLRAGKTLTVNPEGLAQLLGLDANIAFKPNNNPEMCALRVQDLHVPDTYWARDGRHTVTLYNEVVRTICDSGQVSDTQMRQHQIPIAYAGATLTVRPLGANDGRAEVRNQEEDYFVITLPDELAVPPELATLPEDLADLPAYITRLLDYVAQTLGYRAFTEQLQANIYVSAGSVEDDLAYTRTSFGAQVTPEFTWYLPDTPGLYTVWVVLRDNRGGVGWIERTVDVRRREDLPVCEACPNDRDYDWTTATRPARASDDDL